MQENAILEAVEIVQERVISQKDMTKDLLKERHTMVPVLAGIKSVTQEAVANHPEWKEVLEKPGSKDPSLAQPR